MSDVHAPSAPGPANSSASSSPGLPAASASAGPGPGRERLIGAALLVIGVAAVSTGSIFARLAEAPPLAKATWRCALATLVLMALGRAALVQVVATTSRRLLGLAALSGLFLALHFATWIASLDHTSVATSLLLVNTTPIWIVLIGPLVTREPVGRRELVGVALALAGGAWLALGGEAAPSSGPSEGTDAAADAPGGGLLGPLLAVAGAWAATAYFLIGRRVGKQLALIGYLSVCYGAATVTLALAALFTGTPLVGFGGETVLWLVALALVPQLIGHSACNAALRKLPALLVALPLLLEPVVGSLLAWWVLAEAPPARALGAGVLVLAGVALAAGLGRRAER
jgi:drug/metabolite transporter (DMT)-like permease